MYRTNETHEVRPVRAPRRVLGAIVLASSVHLAPLPMGAQETSPPTVPAALPFTIGERLVYRVRVPRMGADGTATMTVTGPVDVRGVPTDLLRFDTSARIGVFRVAQHTSSWLDTVRMASRRFLKDERRPLAHHVERDEIFPAHQRWTGNHGRSGPTFTTNPLDELSFIYYIRTLPLRPGYSVTLDRHFDEARTPTIVRVTGADTIAVEGEPIPVTLVEMQVRDPEQYHGTGIIRLAISDDACRLPVRIESTMPLAGQVILTLRSQSGVLPACSPWSTG